MRALAYEDDEVLQARELSLPWRLLLPLVLFLTLRLALSLSLLGGRLLWRGWRRREHLCLGFATVREKLRVVRELDNVHRLHRYMVDHVIRHGLVHEREQVAVVERPREEGRRMAGV